MSVPPRLFTIVVASGTSQRYGTNKLFESLGNETVLERSVRVAIDASDGVVVVTDPSSFNYEGVFAVVPGGETRSQSVKNGLAVIPEDVEIIAVHDGARPGASVEIYNKGKELIIGGCVGAVPAIKVVDTIKKVDDSEIVQETVPRDQLRAVQTPQIFNAQVLRQAHLGNTNGTDDAALVEKLGHEVTLFEGSAENRKITTPEDLKFHQEKASAKFPRIGTGYDIHPFGNDDSKRLVLGGVKIDHIGLDGHSDSDAVAHALTDALLSAIGAPDLGTLFSANDPKNKGASSLMFLEHAVRLVHNEGYELGNASIVINAQEPKLSSCIGEMTKTLSQSMSEITTVNSMVSITPKHGEGVGEIGRAEAIAVYATVLIIPVAN